MKRFALSTILLFGLAACGGSEPAEDAVPADADPAAAEPVADAAPGTPDWFRADGSTVEMDIVAGQTDVGQYWNFNGAQNGDLTITVPVGATVTINFQNNDPNMGHSIGVAPDFGAPPAMIDATPVFEGAISSNPASMVNATMPGESEAITFTASEAGEYTLVCYIPGHAVSGMWIRLVVSADGEAGVSGSM